MMESLIIGVIPKMSGCCRRIEPTMMGGKDAKHNLCVYDKGYLEFIMDGENHGVVWSKPLPMDRPL